MEIINPVHYKLFEEVTGPVFYSLKTDLYSLSSGILVFSDYNPRFSYTEQRQQSKTFPGNSVQIVARPSLVLPRFPAIKSRDFPATAQEQLLYIFSFFGFSKTELSKIMDVSRPAVYAWLEGTEPEKGKQQKIKKLAQTAFDIDTNPNYPLFHEFINKPVLNYEKSLVDILSSKKKIGASFPKLVRDIYRLTKERRERLESPGGSGYTGNDSILDYNLDSIAEKG